VVEEETWRSYRSALLEGSQIYKHAAPTERRELNIICGQSSDSA